MEMNIGKAKCAIQQADAILLGVSNGLSIAEGYHIFADNDMFRSMFGSFRSKFGIHSVMEGCFYRYPSENDRRDFLSLLIEKWIKCYQPSQVMRDLKAIIGEKPYFILTTNADTHLELSGFSPDKVWEIEGTFFHLLQGKRPEYKQMELDNFLVRFSGKCLVILELGIGSRNTLIKQPLMQLVADELAATYIPLNLPQELFVPVAIEEKAIKLPGDIAVTLSKLRK